MRRFLLISAALHLPLLLLRPQSVAPEIAREPIEISSVPAPGPGTAPAPLPAETRASVRVGGAKLAVGPIKSEVVTQESTLQNTGAYAFISRAIDEVLDFPPELQDQEGIVKATLLFTADGRCHRHVESTSDYLRVLVHRVLREAFKEPLPEKFRGTVRVACTFEFELVRQANAKWDLRAQPAAVMGDHLSFYRARNLWKSYRVAAGPDANGHVAVSGSVDIMDAVEDLLGGTNAQAKVDPLEKYRRDPEW